MPTLTKLATSYLMSVNKEDREKPKFDLGVPFSTIKVERKANAFNNNYNNRASKIR